MYLFAAYTVQIYGLNLSRFPALMKEPMNRRSISIELLEKDECNH